MRIQRLVVKNFRNLKKVDIDLSENFSCIVGENNSGKSNLLLALRLVLDANLLNFNRTLTKDDFSSGLDITEPQQIFVGVEIVDYVGKTKEHALAQEWEVEENKAIICYRFRPNSIIRQKIKDGENPVLNLNDYEWDWQAGSCLDEHGNIKDLSDVEWADEFSSYVKANRISAFKAVFLPAIRDVEEDLRRRGTSPIFKLLEAFDLSEKEKDELVKNIQYANEQVTSHKAIANLSDEIDTALEETVGEIFSLDVELGMASPTFTSIARNLTVLLSGSGLVDADPSRNGLGLNNILYVSMLLKYFEYRIQKNDTAGQLLLIEEPEAHIHPQLQSILFSKLICRECQIVATTHSTHISSRSKLGDLIVLTSFKAGRTSAVNPTSGGNLSNKEVSDLERYLDATRSTLLFAKKVILVEGMSEVFLIPELVKKTMEIDLEEYGISVIPIHGVHFDAYAKLFHKKSIRKKCAILTDGDMKPSDASDDAKIDDDLVRLSIAELKKLENDYLKVFHCKTTFEREIASQKNLMLFSLTAKELNLARTASFFKKVYNDSVNSSAQEEAKDKVLNAAIKIGKARFAQAAAKHIEHAQEIPNYISEAINWLLA